MYDSSHTHRGPFYLFTFLLALLFLLVVAFNDQHDVVLGLEKEIELLRIEFKTVKERVDAASFTANDAVTRCAADRKTSNARSECLRKTIDTLIGVWPDRVEAPDVCGEWPAWKSFGENTDNRQSIKNRSSR